MMDFLDISEQASKFGYYPTYFMQMLRDDNDAVKTARRLLKDTKIQSGLIRLWTEKSLHLSVEAQILKDEYLDLFSPEERRTALLRLEKLGYKPSRNS